MAGDPVSSERFTITFERPPDVIIISNRCIYGGLQRENVFVVMKSGYDNYDNVSGYIPDSRIVSVTEHSVVVYLTASAFDNLSYKLIYF